MTYANYKVRNLTGSSFAIILPAFFGLVAGTLAILYYEFTYQPQQILFTTGIYGCLTLGAWLHSKKSI